jgi:hypothetical protein
MSPFARVSLILLAALGGAVPNRASAQGFSRTQFFFENNILMRLNQDRFAIANSAQWYVTWEAGVLYYTGFSTAFGASMSFGADPDGTRGGLHPRFRKRLSGNTTLDIGAGLLITGNPEGGQESPGFSGMVTVAHGNWVGVTIRVEAIRSAESMPVAYYDPAQDRYLLSRPAFDTDWGVYAGARFGGLPGVLTSALGLGFVFMATSTNQGF